jgi:hypothetical protein
MLRSVEWWFDTDISGLPIGVIFKCLVFQEDCSPWNAKHLKVCPETSVINYQSVLRKIKEERRCHLHRRGSPKSLKFTGFFKTEIGEEMRGIQVEIKMIHTFK